MADDTPKKPETVTVTPTKPRRPSPALAFRTWLQHQRPTFRDLEQILRNMGYQADHTTLSRMSKEFPKWALAVAQQNTELPPVQIIAALHEASKAANDVTPEAYLGIKAQLVARLYETVKTMPLSTIDEWIKGLDACERIEAFIHAERGKAVAAGDDIAQPRGASQSLMNRLNPAVNIPPFKKPGNGAH